MYTSYRLIPVKQESVCQSRYPQKSNLPNKVYALKKGKLANKSAKLTTKQILFLTKQKYL